MKHALSEVQCIESRLPCPDVIRAESSTGEVPESLSLILKLGNQEFRINKVRPLYLAQGGGGFGVRIRLLYR